MAAHRQFGNAVPSALAELLGLEIRRQLLGEDDLPIEISLLPNRKRKIPGPEVPKRVSSKYLSLVGDHKNHPGEGQGPGALRRH